MALQVEQDNVQNDPSTNPSTELKVTCVTILSTTPSASALSCFKTILTHYANETLYDAAARRYILNEFLEVSSTRLMSGDYFALATSTPAIAAEVSACRNLFLDIAVPLLKEGHPLAVHLANLCMSPAQVRISHITGHLEHFS